MSETQLVEPVQELRRLIDGFKVSQALYAAAVLGIADRLGDEVRSSDDLAAAVRADPRALYRLLRALASAGVLTEHPDQRFSLTAVGACLRSDSATPLAGWAAFMGQPSTWQAWGNLLHTVRTGENAFVHTHGQIPWAYRNDHPESGAVFDRAMTDVTRTVTAAVLEAYDFARFATVIDVGGGRGAFLAGLLRRYPQSRALLFDQPHVVAEAPALLAQAGVADRCQAVGGDFFAAVPNGGDAYVLKAVIHDWDDEQAVAILQTCRRAMTSPARLLLIEWDLGGANERLVAKLSDLNMMVELGGQERTADEYSNLLRAAGFRLTAATPTRSGHCVFEAEPV
jgi:hypothetical protein